MSILDEIVKRRREDVERRSKEYPEEWLGKSLAFNPYVPKDVRSALTSSDDDKLRIIAEIKKASPSKGVIREDFDPPSIAQEYEAGCANALSILTEPHYFQGDLDYITMVRRYSSLPILRKDFIVTKYQILESLVYGADFVLLIAAILSKKELKELYEYALHLGMDALVEVHNKEDLLKAAFAGAHIIGINHRNLEDFSMDMELAFKLIPLIPNGKIIVAESGLNSHEQLVELNKAGVDAFLIGEHFMRKQNIKEEVNRIKGIDSDCFRIHSS